MMPKKIKLLKKKWLLAIKLNFSNTEIYIKFFNKNILFKTTSEK